MNEIHNSPSLSLDNVEYLCRGVHVFPDGVSADPMSFIATQLKTVLEAAAPVPPITTPTFHHLPDVWKYIATMFAYQNFHDDFSGRNMLTHTVPTDARY